MARRQAPSRAETWRAVTEGRVTVDGVIARRSSTLVGASNRLGVDEPALGFVSRGGRKLHRAIDDLKVEVAGRRCLDAGVSTGGFTDCLLQWGAEQVVALDVGHGQLGPALAADPRVVALEATNLRSVDPGGLGAPFDLIVADLSFISLCVVSQVLAALSGPGTDLLLLVKPQFEVGRSALGKGGVVRRPEHVVEAVRKVIGCLDSAGLGTVAAIESSLLGEAGNHEYFVLARKGPASIEGIEWMVGEAVR